MAAGVGRRQLRVRGGRARLRRAGGAARARAAGLAACAAPHGRRRARARGARRRAPRGAAPRRRRGLHQEGATTANNLLLFMNPVTIVLSQFCRCQFHACFINDDGE